MMLTLYLVFTGDIDPNNVFQAFFGDQGGASGFNFGGGQFPSNFTFRFQ